MNPKLDQWFDPKLGKTRFRVLCRRCNRKYNACSTPKAAHRSGVKNGYNLETGLCRLCDLEVAKAQSLVMLAEPIEARTP